MGSLGSDFMALACIVGGAAVSGAATWAALDRQNVEVFCQVESLDAQEVTVALNEGAPLILVTPHTRLHAGDACVDVVVEERIEARLEMARERLERAMERAEWAQQRAEAEVDATGVDLDALGERIERIVSSELEARLEAELERLDEELSRLDDGIGR